MRSKCQRPLRNASCNVFCMDANDIHARIRQARLRAGYKKGTEAARAFGFVVPTYLGYENGDRQPGKASARRIADVFKVSLDWLLTGRGQVDRGFNSGIPLVGQVGGSAGVDVVSAPDLAHQVGVVEIEVQGPGMRGLSKDGWRVRFDLNDIEVPPFHQFDGELCLCWLNDGRIMVKTVLTGDDYASVDLASQNEDPIRNVLLDRVSRVVGIFPPDLQSKNTVAGIQRHPKQTRY